ncbi:uncharacterized protein LOC134663481 [Cydia fagiglandana]|uniref:uncharacterized protein LOC134663481 n=1 Tax=Cydia fagiglandana TaxID=1458189 RepID=UPI002FEE6291
MKPEDAPKDEEEKAEPENEPPVAGDVIGDTAYSERFVLKILLKLANLDTLKEEIKEKSFEDDLCTLWDMTAERDVVLFLQKHDILKLFYFALPVIESPRIIEIIVGIIGNLSCHRNVVSDLMKMDNFLELLLDYMKSDDSLVLIQVLRLVNSSLFLAPDAHVATLMDIFQKTDYSSTLYFMLKNSSSKELLLTAIENFNTLCSYCNTEKTRSLFFTNFLKKEAIESLVAGFTEIIVNQKDSCEQDELERVLVITFQIVLNLVGFDKSQDIYIECAEDVANMIHQALCYYERKLINLKEIDSDVIDIIDSSITIINVLKITCDPSKYFKPCYRMWRAVSLILKNTKNGNSFEQDDREELTAYTKNIVNPLSTLICIYLKSCTEEELLKILDDLGEEYERIVGAVKDKEVQAEVSKRTENYRTRLKDNVDS